MRSRFDELAPVVLASVRAGASLEDAARSVGASVNTVHGWASSGRRDPGGRFGAFAAELDGARAQAELLAPGTQKLTAEELHGLIAKAARGGSVPAMRLALDVLRSETSVSDQVDSLAEFDELAAVRARRAS